MTTHAVSAERRALAGALGSELRYSQVWEDHLLLERGLAVTPDDELLMIASAGCNVLNLLLRAPRRIVAIDLNRAQTALLQLKLAAIRRLDHRGFLELLGAAPGSPLARYEQVRDALDPESAGWWDANASLLTGGVERAGRLDRFIGEFQREQLMRAARADVVDRLLATDDRRARTTIANDELFTPEFEYAFRNYFSRVALDARGRSAAQSRFVDAHEDVGDWFLRRLRWVCTELPVRGNFYLERFLRGERAVAAWQPPYLRAGSFERLRSLVDRVVVETGEIEAYLDSRPPVRFTKAALSDVFEYLSPEGAASLFAALGESLATGGRIAYWNLLVARTSPDSLRDRLEPLERLSNVLWQRDRSWFYGAFHVEQLVRRSRVIGAPPADDDRAPRVPARGRYDEAARVERLQWIGERAHAPVEPLAEMRLVADRLSGNIENAIGAVEVPVGLAGPLLFRGDAARGVVYAPLATTEGALVASAARGATAITRAGGVRTHVEEQRMTRAPAFEFGDAASAFAFAAWVVARFDALAVRVGEVSRHATLRSVEPHVIGTTVHVVFVYTTGDAAGQNMTTATTWHACQWILGELPALGLPPVRFLIEGNASGDKKVAFDLPHGGRGYAVTAECVLDREALQVLRVNAVDLVAAFGIVRDGAQAVGMPMMNVNVANAVAALFTATGQDIACVHESSLATLSLARRGDGVEARLTMPGLVVGTVGGGTHLPAQRACLGLLGCTEPGTAPRLAEIVCGYALALELSTLAALATGEFASAHERLGRTRAVQPFTEAELAPDFFAPGLRRALRNPVLHVTRVEALESGSGTSILGELTARRFRKAIGVFHRRVHHSAGHTDVVVKLKPTSAEVGLMMQGLASGCGSPVRESFARYGDSVGFAGCDERELAIVAQSDPRFVRHSPAIYDTVREPARELYAVVMDRLTGRVRLLDSADDPGAWTRADLEAAIRGAGALHAIWLGREVELLRQSWIGVPPEATRMTTMQPLWEALAVHAAAEFPELMNAGALRRHVELVETLPEWWRRIEAMPRTLAHNDFNPRNIAIRDSDGAPRLCAYDWELATIHLPQHDVAELLAFVLPADVQRGEVVRLVELHRQAVVQAGGEVPDAATWREGFALAARDLLVNRFALYLMAHTARQYAFLPRALATLRRLIDLRLELA